MVRMVRMGSTDLPLEVADQIGGVAKHALGFQAWLWKMVELITRG
jgi:hypothetical protein